jgi:hypothetical protein
MAAGYAIQKDATSFEAWQQGRTEAKFGVARVAVRDSAEGRAIDATVYPRSVFGDSDSAWLNARYKALCNYAHSRAGHDNGEFWESNGPLFVPRALATVEREFRETLAIAYLLQRLAWPNYGTGRGQPALMDGQLDGWADFEPMLRMWLL